MDSETAAFVMGANAETHLKQAKKLRARSGVGSRLRGGVGGVYYGIAAYGYPLGAITGVQQPQQQPVEQPLGEQFSGTDGGGGDGGGSMGSGA